MFGHLVGNVLVCHEDEASKCSNKGLLDRVAGEVLSMCNMFDRTMTQKLGVSILNYVVYVQHVLGDLFVGRL